MNVYQKDYSGERIFVTSSLRGYRQWGFNGEGLKSSSYNHYWNPGWNISTCKSQGFAHSFTNDMKSCTCGFYAHHLPLVSYARKSQVLGVVEAQGTIVVGSSGFRAEQSRIIALSGVYDTDQWFLKVPGSKNQKLTSEIEKFCEENDISFFHKPIEMVESYPQMPLESLGVDTETLIKKYESAKAIWKSQNTQARKNRDKAKSDYAKQMAVMKSAAAYIDRGMRDYDLRDPRLLDTMKFLGGY